MTPPPISNVNTVSFVGATPTIVIDDVVYAIGYPVQEPVSNFPAEAVAGTVATVLGVLILAGLALFLHKRRQRREFLNLGSELNDLYGPREVRQHSIASQPGAHVSSSNTTICGDVTYSPKSKESDGSHSQPSPFDGHQFVVPSINLPEEDGLQKTSTHIGDPDQQTPQHEQRHSYITTSEKDLPTPSPFELDKPQLPALSRQEELNADDIVNSSIVNSSYSSDDMFLSTHRSYHSGVLQGLTVETARPERLSRVYGKAQQISIKRKPSSNTEEEQKDDEKALTGEEAK